MNEENLNNTALISLGRIEARLDGMAEKENKTGERLDRLESSMHDVKITLSGMQAQQRPKTPWWVIVGGIAGTVTALLGFWTLFNLAVDITNVVP